MLRILFICHGNICRSVCAHYVFQDLVNQAGLSDCFEIDSAATSREEIGNPIYPPMAKTLRNHDVPLGTHRARQMTRADYDAFDLLIGTDDENLYYMNRICGGDDEGKFHLLMDFCGKPGQEISDPWYTRNFERTYQDVVDGCTALFEYLTRDGD